MDFGAKGGEPRGNRHPVLALPRARPEGTMSKLTQIEVAIPLAAAAPGSPDEAERLGKTDTVLIGVTNETETHGAPARQLRPLQCTVSSGTGGMIS